MDKSTSTQRPFSGSRRFFPYRAFHDLKLYDQRYLPRWSLDNKAYYRDEDTSIICRTQLKDLNVSGACLYVSTDVNPNHKLKLKIYLSKDRSFESEGTVIWKNQISRDYALAGVMFSPMPKEIQELILAYAFEETKEAT